MLLGRWFISTTLARKVLSHNHKCKIVVLFTALVLSLLWFGTWQGQTSGSVRPDKLCVGHDDERAEGVQGAWVSKQCSKSGSTHEAFGLL